MPAAPTLVGSTLSAPFLDVPATGPAFVSGVAADPTDPARTLGLVFTVGDAETPAADLVVTATSGNTAVVTDANLVVSGTGANRTLKITPNGVGYADITVTVTDGEALTATYLVKYAASAAGSSVSRSLVGASDASTAIALDDNFMIVADNEDQVLRLYNRTQSGLPVATFPISDATLGITQADNDFNPPKVREVDIEASTRVGNQLYFMGSLSNASNGNSNRPNRNRVFAVDISNPGPAATLNFVGHYDTLRQDLIAWDVANGNPLGLAASTANGESSEKDDGSSFNIEGLTMAPGSDTVAYLGFRSPIQSPGGVRTMALVVPITNFPALFTGAAPVFGEAIQFDLGTLADGTGRGIRSMESNDKWNADGTRASTGTQVLIVAGPPAGAPAGETNPFKLVTWDGLLDVNGDPVNAPVARAANLTGLNPEAIVSVPAGPLTAASVIQLVSDYGDTDFYGDGRPAKELDQTSVAGKIVLVDGPDNWKKSGSDLVVLGGGIVAFSGATFNVGEAGPTANLTLTRTGDTALAQTVTVAVTGGGATAGTDFTGGPYTVTFAAGATTGTLSIPITEDTAVEGNETVALTISNAGTFGTIGTQATATLTVTDNDQFPTNPPGPVSGGSTVTVTTPSGTTRTVNTFPGFTGAVTTASGDINKDGTLDIIAGASVNGHVKVFDGATGAEIRSFLAFPAFPGGVYVGSGDVNNDGFDDIIVGATVAGHVKVFSGMNGAELFSFFAYAGFTGEARVAGGDVDGDGFDDIITGASVNAHVKAFSGKTGQKIRSFFAYGSFGGGVFVASGDVNGDGRADILTGAGAGAGPHVKVFDAVGGAEIRSFLAYAPNFSGGVRVASRLANADRFADIVVGPGPGGTAKVRTFDGVTLQQLSEVDVSDPLNLGLFVG